MARSTVLMVFLLAGVLAAFAGGCGGVLLKPVPLDQTLGESVVGGDSGFALPHILVVDIDGVIANVRSDSVFSGDNPVSLFVEKLDKAAADDKLAGVILRINSPGGSVAAVDIMKRRLERFRSQKPGIPVIALIEDVGASGGYYMASACDEIIALPTSITGSIGVIMQTFSVHDTMNIIGIRSRAITSGKFKDMGSPFKSMSDDDAAVLQAIVDEFYNGFVNVVVDGRRGRLSEAEVRKLADGRVYTGTQALENGLIDALGDMKTAEGRVKQLGNFSRAKIIMYHRPLGWRGSIESSSRDISPRVEISPDVLADWARPRFMYLWQ